MFSDLQSSIFHPLPRQSDAAAGLSSSCSRWVEQLQRKARAGDGRSQEQLALLCWKGEQVSRDEVKAYMWAWLAHQNGSARAQGLLDEMNLFVSAEVQAEGRKQAEALAAGAEGSAQ